MQAGDPAWHQWRARLVQGWPFVLFAALFLLVAGLVLGLDTDQEQSHRLVGKLGVEGFRYHSRWPSYVAGFLALSTATAIVVFVAARRFAPARTTSATSATRIVIPVLLAGATLLGCFNYLYLDRGVARLDYHKFHDSFHYLLGPKYYDEVGYFNLYNCVIQADAEMRSRIRPVHKVRDLRNYKLARVGRPGHSPSRSSCREIFDEDRWQEFKRDVAVYQEHFPRHRRLLRDHGYNGTPFHAAVAGAVANAFDLSYASMTAASLLDVFALLLACALVVHCFGWRLGLLFALFLSINFSDRYYFIGGSFMRYYWLAFLVGFLCALAKQRYALAAALLTVASMLNVFPLLFLAAIALKVAIQLVRARTLAPRYRRFIVGGALATVVCGGVSLTHERRTDNYRDFFRVMKHHPNLITSSRVGFKYTFLHRQEYRRSDRYYSRSAKRRELRAMAPWRLALTAVALIFGFAVVTRLDDIEGSVLGGMLLFFFLFGTVEYYYAVTAVLLLLWHRRRGPPGPWLLVALLFAVQALVYACWYETYYLKFCNNTVTSFGLAAWLLATVVYLANDTGLLRQPLAAPGERPPRAGPFARPTVLAAAWVLALAVLPASYFIGQAYREQPPPKQAAAPAQARGAP